MSYTLFSVENIDDFSEMPQMWQNFIRDVSSGYADWEGMNAHEANRIIAEQLEIVWFARLVEHYSEERELPVKYELVFNDERSACWFALRWA